jgi:hypothetical protein
MPGLFCNQGASLSKAPGKRGGKWRSTLSLVMAGLVPAIHVFVLCNSVRRGWHSRSKNGVLPHAYA